MLKWIGGGCVMTAGAWLFCRIAAEERRRITVLRDLVAALENMADEIRMNRTPMPRLLVKAGIDRNADVKDFFDMVQMSAGEKGFSTAWRQAALPLPLPEKETQALSELGNCLTGDEEQACRGLLSVIAQLNRELNRRHESAAEVTKRNCALCFSGAALMIILLI